MYNILIVEDDRTIAGAMKKHIDAWGFNARCAEDFRNIMEEFADFNPQLVLLDIYLPFFNGYHWCSDLIVFADFSAPTVFSVPAVSDVFEAALEAVFFAFTDFSSAAVSFFVIFPPIIV